MPQLSVKEGRLGVLWQILVGWCCYPEVWKVVRTNWEFEEERRSDLWAVRERPLWQPAVGIVGRLTGFGHIPHVHWNTFESKFNLGRIAKLMMLRVPLLPEGLASSLELWPSNELSSPHLPFAT
jgi:hypothetical protein